MFRLSQQLDTSCFLRKTSWVLLSLAVLVSTIAFLRPPGRPQRTREHALIVSTCSNGECVVALSTRPRIRRADKCEAGSACRSLLLPGDAEAWSLAGWVRVDAALDDTFETTAVEFGPTSLKFTAPAVPYVAVEAAWPDLQRRFEHKPSLRGHCGDLTIKVGRTDTFDDALRECAQMPGCTVITRSSRDLATHFCQAAYSIEAYDPLWASAVLRDAPPVHQYTGAVALKSWNYFMLTYSPGELHFYVNGFLRQKLEARASGSFHRWIDMWSSVRWYEEPFPGQIGNLRFWPRCLQPNEVALSMWQPLPGRELWLDVTPATEWTGSPVIRSGWANPASLAKSLSTCKAAVVLPVIRTDVREVVQRGWQLQQHAGTSCLATVYIIACSRPPMEKMIAEGTHGISLLVPEVKLHWDACVRYGLEHALDEEPQEHYIAVVLESLLPMENWLGGLVGDLHEHVDAAATFSKVLNSDGTIQTAGSHFQMAYVEQLDDQMVLPVDLYSGYPWNYGPATETQLLIAARCSAWAMRTSVAREVLEDGAFSLELGSNYACSDLLLRLQQDGKFALMSPASVLIDSDNRSVLLDVDATLLFHNTWGADLNVQYAASLTSNATVTWVMHCGGSMGIEAFNLVQYLEGHAKLRAQIQRGTPFCEHVDVLQGTPSAFSARVNRLRRLSAYIPSDIVVHHKDYRQLAAWPWPPNKSSAYLIGRYMWEMDRVHKQWVEQMKLEVDEVWVPSHWHAETAKQQGVASEKLFVIPESLDASLYDPNLYEPLALPRQRRVTFLSVFKLEDRKGWQVLLEAYLKAFRKCSDVSLYIHTVTYPELSYRRDYIYERMNAFLRDSSDPYINSISLFPQPTKDVPHIYVMGQHLSQYEMIRIYSSVDVFVVPSRGEGWGLPYMEAMSLGKPVIATAWSGMTEFLNPDVAFLLNYTLTPVNTTDKWFRGANWAESSLDGLVSALLSAFRNQSDLVMKGRRARQQVMERYDNKVVGRLILDRLADISAKLPPVASRKPKHLDMSKDPVPVDVHMCALLPKAGVRIRRTTPTIKIAVVTTAPPRRCGIATFNTALMQHLAPLLPPGSSIETFPIVWDVEMPQLATGVDMAVRHSIRQENFGDYVEAAKVIHEEGFHVAVLQHEFGIWGGTYGSFVLCFARMLKVPVVSIIHTLSDNLYDEHQYLLQHLADTSAAVVVMSEASRNKLGAYHGIPSDNVVVVPHGVPMLVNISAEEAKAALNLTGNIVLMTNGLMHPGKGIDLALTALQAVVKEFPTVVYLVVGEPHPDCGKECDQYYAKLVETASEGCIKGHVRFVRAFLDDETLMKYVQASDVYVLPYKDRVTTNSGTLTMALAAGKAVVSTPFEHAAAALPGRGRLVDFDSPSALQEGILDVLRNEDLKAEFEQAAREYSARMGWHTVAQGYLSVLTNVTA